MWQVVTLSGSSLAPRLTPDEVEDLARFSYSIHDHNPSTPAIPIWWHRSDDDLSRFWN